MSRGNTVAQHIDVVDAFARTLHVRARQSSPAFADIANGVSELHDALRNLRIEATDPDSPLNGAAYAGKVRPLVEDCDFTLRQLEAVLNHDRSDDDGSAAADPTRSARLSQMLSTLLLNQTSILNFLNTVQLANTRSMPSSNMALTRSQPGIEDIQSKVNIVAQRLFSRHTFAGDHDGLWREFQTELEKEGFSREVLQKHKEVLRAYIRELEAVSSRTGGAPPTVQGLLEYAAEARSPSSEKEVYRHMEYEKFPASMKPRERMPQDAPPPVPPKEPLPELYQVSSPRRQSSQTSSIDERPALPPRHAADSMALISTKDLVDMDTLNREMAGLQVQQDALRSDDKTSPTMSQKYLAHRPPNALPAPPESAELSSSPSSRRLGSSPHSSAAPAYPPRPHSPPPPYDTRYGSPRANTTRLAPDRYGREIPLEAHWTKINRDLVSPEVLERAGVRYEARPTYVAILGRLDREQIIDFARQSADCRAARALRARQHVRADSKSSRDDDDDDDSSDWSGESDTTESDDDKTSDDKGTRSYPYIVSPPSQRASPASTVPPKSILKNKNENHVRFGPSPYEIPSRGSPRSYGGRDDRDRRPRDRSSRRHHSDDEWDRRDRHDRDRRRRHDDRDSHSSHHQSSRRSHHHRDRRSSGSDRNEKRDKKKAWGETLGAVGIGSAAASLLGVLVEAAAFV